MSSISPGALPRSLADARQGIQRAKRHHQHQHRFVNSIAVSRRRGVRRVVCRHRSKELCVAVYMLPAHESGAGHAH